MIDAREATEPQNPLEILFLNPETLIANLKGGEKQQIKEQIIGVLKDEGGEITRGGETKKVSGWQAEYLGCGKEEDFWRSFQENYDESDNNRLRTHALTRYPTDTEMAEAYLQTLRKFLELAEIPTAPDTTIPFRETSITPDELNLHPLADYVQKNRETLAKELGISVEKETSEAGKEIPIGSSVLAEAFAASKVDVGHYVGLYKSKREEASHYRSLYIPIERLGLDAIPAKTGGALNVFDLALDMVEELGFSERDYRLTLKIAEYVALHQAMAFVSDPANPPDLRQKAKRQAQILAIATRVISQDFISVDLDDERMTKLLEEWSVREELNRKIREEFLKGEELPILLESWLKPMEAGDVEHYVMLYRKEQEKLLDKPGQSSDILIGRLGVDKAIGDKEEFGKLFNEVEEQLDSRSSNTRIRVKIAEYVAFHQATAFSRKAERPESLRHQAKRQAQILAIASGAIEPRFVEVGIDDLELTRKLDEWDTKEKLIEKAREKFAEWEKIQVELKPDDLIGLDSVKQTTKDIADWLEGEGKTLMKDFEAIFASDQPVEEVKAWAKKLGTSGIGQLSKTITEKANEFRDKLGPETGTLGVNLRHELGGPLTKAGYWQMLTYGAAMETEDVVSTALKGVLEEYLVLENIRFLQRLGVFEKKGLLQEIKPAGKLKITSDSLDRVASQVLRFFQGIVPKDKFKDVEEIASLAGRGEFVVEESQYFRLLLLNLMSNAIKYTRREEGEKAKKIASDIVIRREGENTFVIENELPLTSVGPEKVIESTRLSLSHPERVFNGRNSAKEDTSKMGVTGDIGLIDRQGLGLGLTVARLCAAKIGMEIKQRIEGNKVITIIRQKPPKKTAFDSRS